MPTGTVGISLGGPQELGGPYEFPGLPGAPTMAGNEGGGGEGGDGSDAGAEGAVIEMINSKLLINNEHVI